MMARLRLSDESMVSFLLATATAVVIVGMLGAIILSGASSVSGSEWRGWQRGFECPPTDQPTDGGGERG